MPDWLLSVTRRCILDDLGFSEQDLGLTMDELADHSPVVRAFRDKRSQNPEGQETVTQLQTSKAIFTLHAGVDRGATWFQKPTLDDSGSIALPGIVWLLAAKFHRSGKAEDAYPYFRRLGAEGRLLPTRDDVRAALAAAAPDFAQSLSQQVPELMKTAIAAPGQIFESRIAGRVPVRVVYEPGDPPVFTVAISQRILPGQASLPPRWTVRIAAAFFPSTCPEDISWTCDLAGQPLREGEVAFCDVTV